MPRRRSRLFFEPRCHGGSSSSSKSSTSSSQSTTSTTGTTSPAYTAGGNITLDTTPQVTEQAFNAITSLVGQALQGVNQTAQQTAQTVNQQGSNVNDLVSAVLAQDQATAANTASGGQTNTNTTIVEVICIAAAALVAVFLFRKK